VVLGVVLIGLVMAAITFAPCRRRSRAAVLCKRHCPTVSPDRGHAARRLRLILSGRDDAGAVLEPQQFEREEAPRLLLADSCPAEQAVLLRARTGRHPNLQCFEDKMAQDCAVCLSTAGVAYNMSRKASTMPPPSGGGGRLGTKPMTLEQAQRMKARLATAAAWSGVATGAVGIAASAQPLRPAPEPTSSSVPAPVAAHWRRSANIRCCPARTRVVAARSGLHAGAASRDANTLIATLTPQGLLPVP
jgi:hypothetical protein